MSKSKIFTGQPIFTQLLQLIPRALITKCQIANRSDYYVKTFKSYDHLVSMLFCVFEKCVSLREVSTGMLAWQGRLNHLGIKSYPKKSTLADANMSRPVGFFEDLYHDLVQMHLDPCLPDSRSEAKIDERLLLMDSTTIDLFSDVMGGAGISKENGKRKGGVKVHMVVNPIHKIPAVVYMSEAKENDRIFMDKFSAPKGSILVFDKGYFKFSQWQRWTEQGIYWVTRLSKVASYQVLEENFINEKQKKAGVVLDQKILLGSGTTTGGEIILARRVKYFDATKSRYFDFVTNHDKFSPSHIADLYKKRWHIELIFKSLKQNYQLKYFLGDNANAICIQIWCSLIADLLMKVVKKSVPKKKWSLSNLCSMIRMHLGTYVNLWDFLQSPEEAIKKIKHDYAEQGDLFYNTS